MTRFCSECGAKQQVGTAEVIRKHGNETVPALSRKPLSFKKKSNFALVALLAIGSAAGHQIIKANTGPRWM